MSNSNKDLSKSTINSIFSNPSVKKNTNNKEEKIFEVFHKKEIVYINNNSNENKDKSKNSQIIQYKCIYCKKKYNNLNGFETHMKNHVRKYKNITFFFNILQTGVKPFKCTYCNKTFKEKGNLKVHIRVHTNERPYHCTYNNICKKSFKTKSQLVDHYLKHTQIKKYNCSECKASFSRKSRFKMHMMIHNGEQPFECEICQKKFRVKSNYNFHMKSHMSKTEIILKYNCDGIKNKSKHSNDIFCIKEFNDNIKSIDNSYFHNNDDNVISKKTCLNINDDFIKDDKDIFAKFNLKTLLDNEVNKNNNICININNENDILERNKNDIDFDNDINSLFKNNEDNVNLNYYNKINDMNEKENIYIKEYEPFTSCNFTKEENIILFEQKKEINELYHYEQSNFNYIKDFFY